MADGTGIQWTDASWNPLRARDTTGSIGWSCVKVSPGCANCYAEGVNRRLGTGRAYSVAGHGMIDLFLNEKQLLEPLRWKKPRRIFLSSMTDIALATDEDLDRIFAVMALTPQHTYQVLTKRPERMRAYLTVGRANPVGMAALELTLAAVGANPKSRVGRGTVLTGDVVHLALWPLSNVWLGVSTENQETADERIPILLATPAAVRFISAEPLLGPIDLDPYTSEHVEMDGGRERLVAPALDWVICGGESGAKARPFDLAWARSLRDQCAETGVPFFMKQLGREPALTLDDWRQAAIAGGHPDETHFRLRDSHGGDESEWPADLRGRRAFPEVGR